MDNEVLSSANVLGGYQNVVGSYRGEDYYTYSKDAQGSTSSITDSNFTAKANYEYSDFGEVTEISETIDNEICYTGAIHDETTGLHYMNARYYDPANGRFISQDSYRGSVGDPGQWHLYVYCANNPINYTDPSGNKRVTLGFGVQLALTFGKWWTTGCYGVDFVWLYDSVKTRYNGKMFHVYPSLSGNVSGSKQDKFESLIKQTPTNILSKSGLKNIVKNMNVKNISLSAGYFIIRGEKSDFDSYTDYTGKFTAVSLTYNHLNFSMSKGEWNVNWGAAITTASGISVSVTRGKCWHSSTLKDYFYSKINSLSDRVKDKAD